MARPVRASISGHRFKQRQKAHDEEWRQSVIKRTGGAPTIRYFDLFLLIDNEKGTVTEFPEAAEIQAHAA